MERVLTLLNKDSVSNGEKLFEKMQESGISVSVFHSV
jgi:pentatricopeptide repeat protein